MRATRFSRGALGAAGVLCLGLSGLGATALAADPIGPGNINFDEKGSILIHKHEKMEGATTGTASGTPGKIGAPVQGVTFTAFKLDADLSDNGVWKKLSELTVPNDACGSDFKSPVDQVGTLAVQKDQKKESNETGSDGQATIGQLAVGAYLVCETASPAKVTEKAAPFVVTVPFPNTEENKAQGAGENSNGKWLYNVNVYPKNVLVQAPEKDVKVVKYGLNDEAQVEFPVTATVPKISDNVSFEYFILSDPMGEGYTTPDIKENSVTLAGNVVDSSWYTKKLVGNEITLSFTKVGLENLKKNPDAKVAVVFTAKTKTPSAKIDNTANLYVNTIPGATPPDTPTPTPPTNVPPVPSNKAVTAWGAASVFKKDKQNNDALKGATFKIYNAADPWAQDCGKAVVASDDPKTDVVENAPISVNGNTEFTTDEHGKFNIDGLYVDSKKGAAGQEEVAVEHNSRCYVLVETKAPEGYVLPTDDGANTALKVTAGETTDHQVDITNTKSTVPQLPLTGAAGKILMTVGGLSLMAIAVGFVLAARKRRANEA